MSWTVIPHPLFSMCSVLWSKNMFLSLPTSISVLLSFRKSQRNAPAALKEHSVQLLLVLQIRKQRTQEKHHRCVKHNCPSSCSPAGPSPQTSSRGAEACGARPASRSLSRLLPTSAQPNRMQPKLTLQVEAPTSKCTPPPLQWGSLQGCFGQIPAPVLSAPTPTHMTETNSHRETKKKGGSLTS